MNTSTDSVREKVPASRPRTDPGREEYFLTLCVRLAEQSVASATRFQTLTHRFQALASQFRTLSKTPETSAIHPLPPVHSWEVLPGHVSEVFTRCSKEGCRCANGSPHGPYYYRIWRTGQQVHKKYVPAAEVELVRAACENSKRLWQRLKEAKATHKKLTQAIARHRKTARRDEAVAAAKPVKRRGRPPGAKNKIKQKIEINMLQ